MHKLVVIVLICLIFLFILIYSVNFYFLSQLKNVKSIENKSISTFSLNSNSNNPSDSNSNNLLNQIENYIDNVDIKTIYKKFNPKYFLIRNKIIKNYNPCELKMTNFSNVWEIANMWTSETDNVIYPQYDSWICKVLQAMQTVPITKARNSKKGTQLKLVLEVEGNQDFIFKPAWYKRTRIIEGPVFSGKDRHNSEIMGFYLGAILNLRWTPIVVGRMINLRHVYDVADRDLRETMVTRNNDTRLCVFGKCFYCKPNELVCGNQNHMVEGVLLYYIPGQIKKHKSPWQRSYNDKKTLWEESDNNYCEFIKTKLDSVRILDLIDASIFDFLIQNGDRHHYETRNNRVILIDNGKGFGNPFVDHLDILAPLYQCCVLRRSTWDRIQMFSGGALTEILKELTKSDLLYPVITEDHILAIERRYLKVIQVVEYCQENYGNKMFK